MEKTFHIPLRVSTLSRGRTLFSALSGFVIAFFCVAPLHALEVTNVTARQRWPWNNLVDIDFVLNTNGTENSSAFAIDITGTYADGAKTVAASTFATTPEVEAGTNRVTWNLGADYPGLRLSDLSLNVQASVTEYSYLVIDLSGGSSAAAYPVRYSVQPPDLSDDACRTDELWLRYIPSGSFTMGSPSGELGREPATAGSETQHSVTLTKGFYIGVFEVTQKQWLNVMGSNPSYYNNAACWTTRPVETVSYTAIRGSVAGVGWPANSEVDGSSFIGKLREKTGLARFDLPTEAQWEYACRAKATTALNSGVNITNITYDANLDLLARYKHNATSYTDRTVPDSQATAKVGSYQPNAWALYDTHGNVWEKCLDWFTAGLGSATAVDPSGPSAADSGTGRIIRGGGCWDTVPYCRSGMRNYVGETVAHARIGFRLTLTQP